MISANSRYASTPIVSATNLDNLDILAITFIDPIDFSFKYQYHMVTGADTIDGLAYKIYGDATLWWVIARLNPEILDFSELPIAYMLRVPITSVPL